MKNLCFLVDHPFDLAFFLSLNKILKKEKNSINIVALVTDHSYFSTMKELDFFLSEFDKVIQIKKPRFGRNIIHNFLISLSFIHTIKKLNKIESIHFISLNRSELTTQILLKYSLNKVTRVLQRGSININDKSFDNGYKKDFKMQFLRNIYEVILALPLSKVYSNKKAKSIKYLHYKNERTDNDLFLTNIHNCTNSTEVHFPFELNQKIHGKDKVYFFGSRFLGWDFLKSSKAIETINEILRKIESIYPKGIELIYKPHPLESIESSYLTLNRFEIKQSIYTAELEFLLHSERIDAVYSIGSTASKTAYNFGIKSYVTYHLFDFDPLVKKPYDDLFFGLPDNFYIQSINDISKRQKISSKRNHPNINNLKDQIGL
jgi:hypothetical protein